MKFQEAVAQLMAGKKLGRNSWSERLYIKKHNDSNILNIYIVQGTDRLLHIDYKFSLDDVLAEDWVLTQ